MTYIQHFTVELNTDNEKEAKRLGYILFEEIMDASWVTALAADPPVAGTIRDKND